MTKRILTIQRTVNLAEDPLTGSAGETYFNTIEHVLKFHDGTSWVALGGGAANLDGGLPNSTYGGTLPINGGTP